jgi:site-specific recombinase XerD
MTGSRLRGEISRQFRVYADQLGLKNFTFHNLRDTYASCLVQKGINLKVIQELLGHDAIQTTMIFARLAPSNKCQAARVIVRMMGNLVL